MRCSKFLPVAGLVLPVLLASASVARAEGPYVGLGLGGNFNGSADFTGTSGADFDNSVMGGLTAGHAFANGLRPELELGYRDNGVDSVGGANGSGDAKVWSLMANALYDFKIDGSAYTPYLGLGLGYANVDYNNVGTVNGSTVNDSDGALAYQGILGVSRALNDTAALTLDYRYFATNDADTRTAAGAAVGGDYDSHAIMLGVRFNLGAPAKPAPEPTPVAVAPPPPKPAPAPVQPVAEERVMARAYMVFFDWNKATLTPEALDILRTAADNAKKGGVSRVAVTGHADRSGTDKYNMGLSKKRAQAVEAELRRLGMTDKDIGVAWKGESEPLVATDDGVREPQNRRVEIVLP